MAGHIISVFGGKGGVGKSVFASNFAYAFSRETNTRACLVDLDFKAEGDQNHINGLLSKHSIYDLCKHSGALDAKVLSTLVQKTPGGIYYVGLPSDPHKLDEIQPDELSRFLKVAPSVFQTVVIDCGSEVNEWALRAFEHSTMVLVVTNPDVLVINQTKKVLGEIQKALFPNEMVQIVLNKYSQNAGMPPQVIQKSLNKSVLFAIPEDANTCVAALLKRQPFVWSNPRVPITRAYHDGVRKIIQLNLLENLAKLNKPSPQKRAETSDSQGLSVVDSSGGLVRGGQALDSWTALKIRVHKALVEQMDLKKIDTETHGDSKKKVLLREKTKKKVLEILNQEDTSRVFQGRDDMAKIVKEILDEALALGPLEDLLMDKSVTEIMVNARDQIYIEKNGKPQLCKTTFSSDTQLMNIIERIVAPLGRRIDEKSPYVDARLEDGSRVHAIIPPLALKGPTITIRKFPEERLTYKDLIGFGSMTQEIADFLKLCVEAHLNIIVSGGTGSGKTTLPNMLSNFIPATDRIITVEDSAELQLGQEHVVRLETRPPNIEGQGEVSIRDLVKQTLRMRPDRIVVGECRAGEALDMLQAMNTGHDGSLTTIHANTPRDTIARLETLVMMAGMNLPTKAIREQIASAVHLIVQQARLSDGSRKITHVTEITGMQGDTISMQDIFVFKQEGLDKRRRVVGRYVATGFVPKFVEELEARGIKIPRGLFTSGKAA